MLHVSGVGKYPARNYNSMCTLLPHPPHHILCRHEAIVGAEHIMLRHVAPVHGSPLLHVPNDELSATEPSGTPSSLEPLFLGELWW